MWTTPTYKITWRNIRTLTVRMRHDRRLTANSHFACSTTLAALRSGLHLDRCYKNKQIVRFALRKALITPNASIALNLKLKNKGGIT